ncbi:TAXI family TRAP transporter solute-binding subunit [Fulvimarina sp. MAC3]|uniref:TAXI family TRAP transporter solute-binding subunit n=1 Tax=Fulvimarina sp. MAC3 TaxID=3148887 RepID=UPI0031FC3517
MTNSIARRAALKLGVAFTVALGLAGTPAKAQEEANYILATASTGGTYYPVGVAIATLVKTKLQPEYGIGLSAINSAGSAENVRLLRENEAQFAILQGLFGYYARTGTGPLESEGPQKNLRSMTMLWQNVEHFVVAEAAAETGTMSDFVGLKGSNIGLGGRNSGSRISSGEILKGLGVDPDKDYSLMFAGYGPTAEALQNGQISGLSTPAGVPAGAISQLKASMGDGAKILNFTPEQREQADQGRELWTEYVIPSGTYPGQKEDVTTIAQPNFLALNADLPEENVYLITKAIYENLPFLQAIHPATKAMSLEKAIEGLPLPLHPGAIRYYEEQGITIPDRLKAN